MSDLDSHEQVAAREANLFRSVLVGFGCAVIVFGAFLELRHLVKDVVEQFQGCATLGEIFSRLLELDDLTLAGVAMCALLVAATVAALCYHLKAFWG